MYGYPVFAKYNPGSVRSTRFFKHRFHMPSGHIGVILFLNGTITMLYPRRNAWFWAVENAPDKDSLIPLAEMEEMSFKKEAIKIRKIFRSVKRGVSR